MSVLDNLNRIKKKYSDKNLVFSLTLLNYADRSLYIRLEFKRKYGDYKLYWYELTSDKMKLRKERNELYLTHDKVESFVSFFKNNIINYDDEDNSNDNRVIIYSPYPSKNNDTTYINFHDYIPLDSEGLKTLIFYTIELLPSYYDYLKYQLNAKIGGYEEKFEYQKSFSFDLFNDNLDSIFKPQIITRGNKYYKEDKVSFLELVNDRYFAIVNGLDTSYLVVVKYDEKEHRLQLYCNCPCEFFCKHIYAVILAIRNNKFNPFYKIKYKDNVDNYLDELLNFDYFLCAGLSKNNNLILVSHDGEVIYTSVFDNDGRCKWQVVSDDEKLSLTLKLDSLEYNDNIEFDFNEEEKNIIKELNLGFEINKNMTSEELELFFVKIDEYLKLNNSNELTVKIDNMINKMYVIDDYGNMIIDLKEKI